MTAELLERLYAEQENDVSGLTEKADVKRTDMATVKKVCACSSVLEKTFCYFPVLSISLDKISYIKCLHFC